MNSHNTFRLKATNIGSISHRSDWRHTYNGGKFICMWLWEWRHSHWTLSLSIPLSFLPAHKCVYKHAVWVTFISQHTRLSWASAVLSAVRNLHASFFATWQDTSPNLTLCSYSQTFRRFYLQSILQRANTYERVFCSTPICVILYVLSSLCVVQFVWVLQFTYRWVLFCRHDCCPVCMCMCEWIHVSTEG